MRELKTHRRIELGLAKRKPGAIIFPSEFRGSGTDSAIKKAMSRLAKTGHIKRLAHGIYYVPKRDPILGNLRPDPDEVLKMIARKEHIRIRPAGAYALHRLGLTSQVPTRRIYLTDGNPRQIRLGNIHVQLKSASAKRLSMQGEISSLVIQAIEELGVENISDDIASKLKTFLLREDPQKLKRDLELAPVKVCDFIFRLLKQNIKE